jgi:hypothetical protein
MNMRAILIFVSKTAIESVTTSIAEVMVVVEISGRTVPSHVKAADEHFIKGKPKKA